MRAVADLKFSRVGSVDELFSATEPSILWLRDSSPCRPNLPLLAQSDTNEEIDSGHHEAPESPPLGLAVMRGGLVSGNSIVGTDDAIFRMSDIVPTYIDYLISSGRPWIDLSLEGKEMIELRGTYVLITHLHWIIYGHWLLECLPKLLFMKDIAGDLPPFKFIVPDVPHVQPFVVSCIKSVAPNASIVCYDATSQAIKCETLLMPSLPSSRAYFFNDHINSLLHHAGAASTEAKRLIYVGRRGYSHFRKLENRQEIESIAEQLGLEIFIPEDSVFSIQVKTFSEARLVVGEFGSSMHNALFSPMGTNVLCLNWISHLQSRVSCLRRQPTGYILPSNGKPLKFVEGAASASYHIDPDRFRRTLETLVPDLV
jgi:hypothetical protein